MSDLTPAQRTATTAKVILAASLITWATAVLKGSVMTSMLAGALMLLGGGLLMAARRAD